MASLYEFSRQIADLRKEKRYSEVLQYFKDNKVDFDHQQISNNEYIISDMITCLRKTNNFDAGFKFLNIYGIEINSDTKEKIVGAYGWLLWSKYKAVHQNDDNKDEENDFFDEEDETPIELDIQYNKDDLITKIEQVILLLFRVNNPFHQTLISNLFSIVLKSEKKKPAPNWRLVNDFCNNINPEMLSHDCSTIQVKRKGKIKDMELASDFENWYAYKTKALVKLGEWDECFKKSKEALEKIESFHYSNDIWFSRRIAISKKNLGNTEDAISELETILRKKSEWFIQKEVAELYFDKDDLEHAFRYAIDAINNFGPMEFKVDLLFLLGKILLKKEENDLAFKHFTLSKLLREVEDWKVPQKVKDELKNFTNPEINIDNIETLKLELKKYWTSNVPKKKKFFSKPKANQNGEIVKILNDNARGKDGFLKSDNKEFYFSLSANYYLTPKIQIGTQVEFNVTLSTDGKRNQTRILQIIE